MTDTDFPQFNLLTGKLRSTKGALIDMDGVLYDSMKYHTLAWHKMMTELGLPVTRDEFYLYEGMTGAATINLLFKRHLNRECDCEEVKRLYAVKTRYFHELGQREPMPGADRMINALMSAGIPRVLVTGSGQASILDGLNTDYPGAFPDNLRVTAADVVKGKPDPEPYLKGLEKLQITPSEAIVIENAPLGVRAGKDAGIFTIAVTTGPIPRIEFEKEGADIIFPSMDDFADTLTKCVTLL
ncbi:MAG: HAD-IA family hydrolase [Muribaculaceae bacterium]|nr:HAD-IA family hydrolase [Muribaculaceae bacterium]